MVTMTFRELIELIRKKLKTSVQLEKWEFTPLYFLEESESCLRVVCKFSLGKLSWQEEIKFVEEYFKTIDDYDTEIKRRLNRFDSFTNTLSLLQNIEIENQNKPLPNEESWKGTLTKLVEHSPIEATAHFIFSKVDNDGQLISFEKEFNISANTFISFETYLEQLNKITQELNNLIIPTVIYYQNTITQTNY